MTGVPAGQPVSLQPTEFRLEPGPGRLAQRIPLAFVRPDWDVRWFAWGWLEGSGLTAFQLTDADVADWTPVEVRPVEVRSTGGARRCSERTLRGQCPEAAAAVVSVGGGPEIALCSADLDVWLDGLGGLRGETVSIRMLPTDDPAGSPGGSA